MKPEHEASYRRSIAAYDAAAAILKDAIKVTQDERLYEVVGHLTLRAKALHAELQAGLAQPQPETVEEKAA